MNHFFADSRFEEPYFTYPELYRQFAEQIQDGGTIVELGSWKGQSASCMCVELKRRNKNRVNFFCVDTWEGSGEEGDHNDDPWVKQGKLYDKFKDNLREVSNYYIPLRMTTEEASNHFVDGTVDIVFIDAEHSYEGVKNDILKWLPKVRKGGIISGHDYAPDGSAWPEVKRAVDEAFGNRVHAAEGACWFVEIL